MRISRIVSAVIFGIIFSACGCLMGYFFGQQTTLNCLWVEPMQIECNMKKSWLGLVPLGEESVRGLEGAMVDESCDEDGCTYRVELDTADGIVPLTSFYLSDDCRIWWAEKGAAGPIWPRAGETDPRNWAVLSNPSMR